MITTLVAVILPWLPMESEVVAKLSGLATHGGTARGHFAPYVLTIALFWFLYTYMPNTKVRLGPAFVGAVFGGALWAAVGALFARIVIYSAKTAAVYAGFAVVLLFLLWLYLSWLMDNPEDRLIATEFRRCTKRCPTPRSPLPATAARRRGWWRARTPAPAFRASASSGM